MLPFHIDSIRNEVDKQCELIYEFDSVYLNNTYYLCTINSFCMCVLSQFLIDAINTYNYKLKNLEQILDDKSDIKQMKNKITEEYLQYIYDMFDHGFKYYEYDKNIHINQDFLDKTNILLSNLNVSIIEKLTGVKPHIFIADSNGHCAIATTISIVLNQELFLDENDELNLETLFLTIVNVLTECTITRLFKQILTVFDITKLQEIYETTNEKELKIKIGQSIANNIVDNKIDKGLKLLLNCTKEHFEILKNL